jgi:hypothetical protein
MNIVRMFLQQPIYANTCCGKREDTIITIVTC